MLLFTFPLETLKQERKKKKGKKNRERILQKLIPKTAKISTQLEEYKMESKACVTHTICVKTHHHVQQRL